MSTFRLKLHKFSSGGGVLLPVGYDTRFGTAVDSTTGQITFGLKPGCRQVFLGSGGSDSNTGLSWSQRKATINGAAAVYMGSGHTPGDQLIIGGGATYSDDGLLGLFEKHGANMTCPNAVLSCDPLDPTNTAKYGWLLGDAQPVISINQAAVLANPRQGTSFDSSKNYHAVQGVTFLGNEVAGTGTTQVGTTAAGVTGIAYQNTRWNKISCYFDVDETSTTANWGSDFLMSHSSGWGQWRNDGNKSWLYISGTNRFVVQDCVGVHNGWNMARTRSDTDLTTGAAHYLGHGIYFAAENSAGQFNRILGIDPAQDMFSLRGEHTGICHVGIDSPVFHTFGGYSGGPTEWPQGSLDKLDDFTAMGGADINASLPRGIGFGVRNTVSGSYIKNGAMFDNPIFLGTNNILVTVDNDVSTLTVTVLIDGVSSYNYASYSGGLQTTGGSNSAGIAATWTNNKNDVMAPGGAGNGNAVWGSAPPGYKTRAQVYGLLGFTADATQGKKELVNWVANYPHLAGEFAMAIDTIGLQTMGKTPTKHPTRSVPSLSGLSAATGIY